MLEQVFRDEWGRVLASLVGFLGDFDLAEEATQEAFAVAAERWPRDGVPANPGGVAGDDGAQPRDRPAPPRAHAGRQDRGCCEAAARRDEDAMDETTTFPDERLELVFTCCHPALAVDAQVALTLRTLGGLTTDEIARAFLVPERDDGQAARRGPSARSATRASRSGCRPSTCCPTGSPPCWRSST